MSRRQSFWLLLWVTAVLGLQSSVPAQQEGEMLQLALPRDVFVVVGQSLVIITGRPTSASPVNCAAGVSRPASAVVVDEGGGNAAQQTAVLVFRETEPRNGTRIRIVGGPALCNAELLLYEGIVE